MYLYIYMYIYIHIYTYTHTSIRANILHTKNYKIYIHTSILYTYVQLYFTQVIFII